MIAQIMPISNPGKFLVATICFIIFAVSTAQAQVSATASAQILPPLSHASVKAYLLGGTYPGEAGGRVMITSDTARSIFMDLNNNGDPQYLGLRLDNNLMQHSITAYPVETDLSYELMIDFE